jgi:hypothetical protein
VAEGPLTSSATVVRVGADASLQGAADRPRSCLTGAATGRYGGYPVPHQESDGEFTMVQLLAIRFQKGKEKEAYGENKARRPFRLP